MKNLIEADQGSQPYSYPRGLPSLREPIPAHSLDQVVQSLAYRKDLDATLPVIPHWAEKAMDQATRSTRLAFEEHNPTTLLAIHRSLKTLYDLHLFPQSVGSENQHNPFLGQIRQTAENGWMAFEQRRSIIDLDSIPQEKTEFSQYFQNFVFSHPAANHRLYTFLEQEASIKDVTRFFLSEYPLNVRFFDIVTLAALGTDSGIRQEVSKNLWDESGRGIESRAHTTLFKVLVDLLGANYEEDQLVEEMGWEALAGYNLFLYLGLHRKNYYRFVGCLAATELIDPPQYSKFLSGCGRLCLDSLTDLTYYREHVEVDIKHGSGWIDNVMLPILDSHENAPYQILLGAEMRLNTAKDYYDAMYLKLRSGAWI